MISGSISGLAGCRRTWPPGAPKELLDGHLPVDLGDDGAAVVRRLGRLDDEVVAVVNPGVDHRLAADLQREDPAPLPHRLGNVERLLDREHLQGLPAATSPSSGIATVPSIIQASSSAPSMFASCSPFGRR
ncbi:MAG: hypothetical protein U0802_09805 [Candidatus Binatia bacterium]